MTASHLLTSIHGLFCTVQRKPRGHGNSIKSQTTKDNKHKIMKTMLNNSKEQRCMVI